MDESDETFPLERHCTALIGAVRVNTYAVVCRAVEDGLYLGFHRANKRIATLPEPDSVAGQRALDALENAVLEALHEVLIFHVDPDDG